MNKEQAEAAARAIMDAETRKLEDRRLQTARKQAKAAKRQRLAIFAGVGYFVGISLGAAFGWASGPAGLTGLIAGFVTGWWLGRNAPDDEGI